MRITKKVQRRQFGTRFILYSCITRHDERTNSVNTDGLSVCFSVYFEGT